MKIINKPTNKQKQEERSLPAGTFSVWASLWPVLTPCFQTFFETQCWQPWYKALIPASTNTPLYAFSMHRSMHCFMHCFMPSLCIALCLLYASLYAFFMHCFMPSLCIALCLLYGSLYAFFMHRFMPSLCIALSLLYTLLYASLYAFFMHRFMLIPFSSSPNVFYQNSSQASSAIYIQIKNILQQLKVFFSISCRTLEKWFVFLNSFHEMLLTITSIVSHDLPSDNIL